MNVVTTPAKIIALVLLFVTSVFAQRYAVTSGNWTDAIWSDTQGGLPGSAATPTSADNIIINTSVTVNVNTPSASCLSVSFQDSTGTFTMGDGAVLNIYGDFNNDSAGTAFTSWATGAKLRFTGSNQQYIRGFRQGSNSLDKSVLMEVVVDKSADTLKTPGIDMKLGIGTSLEIVRGFFVLGYRDDINGRIIGGDASNPTITVDSGAGFTMVGSLSAIRSGVSGKSPIGKITLHGAMHVATTSSIGISFGGVEILSGGQLYMESFTSTYKNIILDTVHVRRGGEYRSNSATNYWNDSVSTNNVFYLDSGGVYKATTSTTYFPQTFFNTGTVRYQRATSSDSTQTIVDMNYYRLEISFGGPKNWTMSADRYIFDSLEINNKGRLVLSSSNGVSLNVLKTMRLTSGYIDNTNENVTLVMADGSNISRATGEITAAPYFDGGVNLRYSSTVSSVTTGPEVPTSSSIVQDFQILCDTTTVTLGTPLTINGTCTLSNGNLNNEENTLSFANGATIKRATGTITAPPIFEGIIYLSYISSIASVTTGYEVPASANSIHTLTIMCDTNTVTLSAPLTVNNTLTLSNGILDNSAFPINLVDGASIRRATGTIVAAPVFAGTVNVAYISTVGSVLTGDELPTATNILKTLSIQSPKNVTLTAPVTVNDTLSVTRGFLYLGNNDVTLGTHAVVSGTPADTSMLVTDGSGKLVQSISSVPFTQLFPVGDTTGGAGHYSPATITLQNGSVSAGAFLGVSASGVKHPQNDATTDYLKTYWVTMLSGVTDYVGDLTVRYSENQIVGDENQMMLIQRDGSRWNWLTTADPVSNTLSATGLTLFSEFSGAPRMSGTVQLGVVNGWNLISVPVEASEMTRQALFPDASSAAFGFHNGYYPQDTLQNGIGYWLKFDNAGIYSLLGYISEIETISVYSGWNMIGSLAIPIHKTSVTPLGTSIASNYFLYNAGYNTTDTLKAGSGFWVKVTSAGKLVLAKSMAKKVETGVDAPEKHSFILRFTDSDGRKQQIFLARDRNEVSNPDFYEMPPVPPSTGGADVFDVRYSSHRILECMNKTAETEYPITISSGRFPVTLALENSGSSQLFVKIGNTTTRLTENNPVVLKDNSQPISLSASASGTSKPASFSCAQNYPNPFNPSTVIRYSLPVSCHVTLKVYTIIGQEVMTLIDADQEAGYQSVQLKSHNLPSGVYFYKLTAGSFSQVRKMIVAK